MESEFRRIMSQPVESVSVVGNNILEFGDGAATVTWGTTFTAVIPSDGLTMTFVETFGGTWTGTYTAFPGRLSVETVSSTLTMTITTYINGNPTEPTTTSPDPFGGAEMTYECLGNDLTTHPTGSTVVNAFHRVNPTE